MEHPEVEGALDHAALPPEASGPILAAAFGAILLTPVSQRVAARAARWLEAAPRYRSWEEHRAAPPLPAPERMSQHAVVIGHGRVGRVVCAALRHHGLPHVVVEAERALAEHLRAEGTPVVWGDATRPEVLAAACPATARLLILCVPDAVAERDVLALARAANPQIAVAARAHDEEVATFLADETGVGLVVMGQWALRVGVRRLVVLGG